MLSAYIWTNRRREIQVAYNIAHGIEPTALRKRIADITDLITKEIEDTVVVSKSTLSLPRRELVTLIESLTDQMKLAAVDLHFELAGRLRDEIRDLKRELREMEEGEA